MTVYLDASVVVRKLQREAGSLKEWGRWERAYSSELLRIEVFRAVDRARLRGALTDNEVADIVVKARAILDGLELLQLSQSILNRAAQSFLTPLGTLDALHLATAVRLTESTGVELTFLTHDAELGTAARSMNFAVQGVVTS
jgi:predicted nucleic acid-binding protein